MNNTHREIHNGWSTNTTSELRTHTHTEAKKGFAAGCLTCARHSACFGLRSPTRPLMTDGSTDRSPRRGEAQVNEQQGHAPPPATHRLAQMESGLSPR